jgi:hypothetical protein
MMQISDASGSSILKAARYRMKVRKVRLLLTYDARKKSVIT